MSLANIIGLLGVKPAITHKTFMLPLTLLDTIIKYFSTHQHLQICVLITHINNHMSQEFAVPDIVILL